MLIVFDNRTNYQKIDYDGESFVKGDYSVHTIDVLMKHDTEYDTYTYTGSLQFKRSDGQTSPKLVMTPKKIEYDGKVYNGYTYKMEGDWFTEIAGVLKMSVSISTYNEGGTGASTNKAYANIEINVEDSVVETIPTTITDEEYTALINVINSKLNKGDETIYRLTNLFGTTQKFAEECIAKLTEIQTIKIFLGFVADDDGTLDSTIGLVGDKNSSVLVISGKGDIEKYKNNELQVVSVPYLYTENIEMGNAAIDLLKVSGDLDIKDAYIIAKEPEKDNDLVTKKYVDSQTSLGYSKTETDNLLLNKANKSDVYGKNETYSKTETDKKIADLVNSAPETLDTLGEIAEGIKENQDIIATLNNAISNKANINEVYTKQEANALLNNKANTSTTYSKTETDTLLKEKANNSEVYNKEEIDDFLKNINAGSAELVEFTEKAGFPKGEVKKLYIATDTLKLYTWSGYSFVPLLSKDLDKKANADNVYTKTETDNKIAALVNSAPETLDTLGELAKALQDNQSVVDTLDEAISNKANVEDVYTKEEVDNLAINRIEINRTKGVPADTIVDLIKQNKASLSYMVKKDSSGEIIDILPFVGSEEDGDNIKYIWASILGTQYIWVSKNDLSFVNHRSINEGYYNKSETYSKSEINTQLNKKANKSDVYEKNQTYSREEIDILLGGENGGVNLSNYYTKQETYNKDEIDTKLNEKANLKTTYTKTETDNLLLNKANSNDVYLKTETYSKTEIDDLLSGENGEVNLSNYYTKTETNNLIAENKEIVEFSEALGFPTGEYNKLYVAGDTLRIYTWSGYSFVRLYSTDLNNKANVDDVYNKTQMDTLLVSKVDKSQKGVANGVAELDANGKVPTSQLPSYVDDVLEFSSKSVFPTTGESGKIYVALDTNITYRWGGTEYVEISSSLALGETSSTAYAGDKGKANADAITALQTRATNIETNKEDKANLKALAYKDSLTKTDVGLGNVDNTSDLDKPISTATQTALNAKANNSDVYLRETVNNLLATKADLSNTYTKNEVDTIVGNINTILDTLNGEVI